MNKKNIDPEMGAAKGFAFEFASTIIGGLTNPFTLSIFMLLFFSFSTCGGQNEVVSNSHSQLLGPGDHKRKLQVNDIRRIYFVHVPASYTHKRPVPVVLNLHGGGGTPKSQRHMSMMDKVADQEGFIVVYPQGTNRRWKIIPGYTWNAGTCCGWAEKNNIDDVAFIDALLDDLEKIIRVDRKRIYATGHSNGAMMCYRLACRLSHRIAAIAPVSGPMQMKDCRPSRPVSVMHFHGTQDAFVPLKGGEGQCSLPGQFFTSVDKTIKFWLEVDGIKSKKPKADKVGNAAKISYGKGANGAEVVLWKLEGGGHTWPGGRFGFLKKKVLGEMNMNVSASRRMWDFFCKHPMP